MFPVSPSKLRSKPHRRTKPGYKSPSTSRHTQTRRRLFNNLTTLSENYGMDTTDVQFVLQDFYYKFEEITENGDSIWKRINLDKRRIIWLNPNNGFAIAALKDLEFEIKLPNAFSSFDENLEVFKSLWMKLEYDLNLLYENIKSHTETMNIAA